MSSEIAKFSPDQNPAEHPVHLTDGRYNLRLLLDDQRRHPGALGTYTSVEGPSGDTVFDAMVQERFSQQGTDTTETEHERALEQPADSTTAFRELYGPEPDDSIWPQSISASQGELMPAPQQRVHRLRRIRSLSSGAVMFRKRPNLDALPSAPALPPANTANTKSLEAAQPVNLSVKSIEAAPRPADATPVVSALGALASEAGQKEASQPLSAESQPEQPTDTAQKQPGRSLPKDYPVSAADLSRIVDGIRNTPLPKPEDVVQLGNESYNWFGGSDSPQPQPDSSPQKS